MSLREATTTRLEAVLRYPADLAGVSVLAALAYYLVTALEVGSELRVLAALPLVLFLPGYALIAVLFPARGRVSLSDGTTRRGVDAVERAGLGLATSIALVPIVVIGLSLSVGLTTETVAAVFAVTTVVFAQIGAVRRLRVPRSDRFSLPSIRPFDRPEGTGSLATASTVLLVVAVAVAGAAFAFAIASPTAAGGFTQLGIYTEDDGELVAGGFPSTVEPGESIPFVTEVENQEGEDRTYTVVVEEQTLEGDEVIDRTTLDSTELEVADDETVRSERTVTPTTEAGTVRIAVLLYSGEVPAERTGEGADEDTFFWVDVTTDADADDEDEAAGDDGVDNETDDEGVDDEDGDDEGVGDGDADDGDGDDEGVDDEDADDEDADDEDGGLFDDGFDAAEDGIDAIQDGIDAIGDLFED